MAARKTLYVCHSCGYESAQWAGQCPSCRNWNTFEETLVQSSSASRVSTKSRNIVKPVFLSTVSVNQTKRLSSGLTEFDRVLGGGFVPGQVIILAGEPGVGKSTLLTQISMKMPKSKILYICGEESVGQIKLRADRMNYKAENLLMLAETDVISVTDTMENSKDIDLVIIDSIQTLTHPDMHGAAGSIGQVRGTTQVITNTAKRIGVPVILVGHITKSGSVAGPKVMEHIVDTVLYLEGDTQHLFRILKTTKNRFGPVSEIGMFEMGEKGMTEVLDPSKLFLEAAETKAPGSCITVVMEGFRPILFEVQALTSKTAFGYPRRTASGFSSNRLEVLIAVLEKRCGLSLSDQDVYVSVAGGLKISEYAADLAVCIAIASSLKNKPVGSNIAVFGECGLLGEVRKVPHEESRAKEAKKLGFTQAISGSKVKTVAKAIKLALE